LVFGTRQEDTTMCWDNEDEVVDECWGVVEWQAEEIDEDWGVVEYETEEERELREIMEELERSMEKLRADRERTLRDEEETTKHYRDLKIPLALLSKFKGLA